MKVAPEAPVEDTTLGILAYVNPKYVLFKGENDEFYFNLTARNGEILLSSEGYASRAGALNGIESVRKNAANAQLFEKRVSEDGQHYFVLKARNHQIIGDSETYSTEEARDNGINSVMRLAPAAPIEDKIALDLAINIA
ncbi:MAG: YegP family protein [Saprospiraceae bacterium]